MNETGVSLCVRGLFQCVGYSLKSLLFLLIRRSLMNAMTVSSKNAQNSEINPKCMRIDQRYVSFIYFIG